MFVTTIHLREDQKAYLDKLADKYGVSVSQQIRRAIDGYLELQRKNTLKGKGSPRLNIAWTKKGTSVLMKQDPQGEFIRWEEHLRILEKLKEE